MQNVNKFVVRKVAILGAGVMGAQIAAHFASADIPVILFDLPGNTENRNAIVLRALEGLQKLHPAPFTLPNKARAIEVANYEDSLASLKECDLVIEAISERLDWKENLYHKVIDYISPHALFVTNTSGLSINTLANTLPASLQPRFFGVHFFNPPGYMPLVELIPGNNTDKQCMKNLESFLVTALGKNIVYARDTPNFIANRVGVFSMLITLHAAARYGIELDVVDALTGPLIGRPKSATLRTADVVGLDTFVHAVSTMKDNLQSDPWHACFDVPYWMHELIQKGALGQKTHQGVYKKEAGQIFVFDLNEKTYRPATVRANKEVLEILKIKNISERFISLKNSPLPEAQFLWYCFREVFHYSAYHLIDIAQTVRDVDQAMRWGFGWQQGPFEIWQSADWLQIVKLIQQDIDAGESLVKTPLPEWVWHCKEGVYQEDGAFAPRENHFIPRRHLSVYDRQLFPECMPGEKHTATETLLESEAVRLWRMQDDIAILSFKTKMGVIDNEIIDGINEAIDKAEQCANGLVLWTEHSPHFSAGANLKAFADMIKKKNFQAIHDMLEAFQQACLRLRYATIPVVAAVQGYALGGGCEVMLHADAITASLRSHMGLVEIGVGLLPAGGGCKEMAQRAARQGEASFAKINQYFKQIAMAMASTNAQQAKEMDYLRSSDPIMFHPEEILYIAKAQATFLSEAGYQPPLPSPIKVLGTAGLAQLMPQLVNMHEGHFISDHDFLIASYVAKILCGGAIDPDSLVTENWLLKLEREYFLELAQTKETMARIEHMLQTGKPLRN